MKHFIIVLTIICPFLSFETKNTIQAKSKIQVSVYVSFTEDYCGGAEPDPEIMKEMRKPHNFKNKKIYIKAGEKNTVSSKIIFAGTTDSVGIIELRLKPGKYILVDERKCDRKFYAQILENHEKPTATRMAVNKECLDKWWAKPDLMFEIKTGDPKSFNVNYHLPCSWNTIPCAEYTGAYPP